MVAPAGRVDGGQGLSHIDKQAVLDRIDFADFYGRYVELPRNRHTESICLCPFHADTNKSLSINLKNGLWNCHAGCGGGDVFSFYEKVAGVKFAEALKALARIYGLLADDGPVAVPKPKARTEPEVEEYEPIDPALVTAYHKTLLKAPKLLEYLTTERGLMLDTIKSYRIGYCLQRSRYTLPVYDSGGKCVNIRMYKPHVGDGESKIESYKVGYGTVRLYPSDKITGESVLLTEGEFDCLLARQNGFDSYTATSGADSFPARFAPLFKGKQVNICYDIDAAGKQGAKKTAKVLDLVASEVRIVPLPIDDPPNGDLTDFFIKHKFKRRDLEEAIDDAVIYKNGRAIPVQKAFRDLYPQGSFLDFYVQSCSDLTDAPVEFHLAAGLTILSAAVGNRVWFRAWGKPVYPNLWTILLAPSGFFRKSTAIDLGMRLLKRVTPDSILPNEFTQERLMDILGAQPAGIVPVREFGSLLKYMRQDYNMQLREFLTEIYDAESYRKETKGGGKVEIQNPALSILGATTIDWVVSNTSKEDLGSGFFARFVWWPATKKNGWRGLGDVGYDYGWTSLLEENLRYIVEHSRGEATIPPYVLKVFNQWLKRFESEVNEHGLPSVLQGFYIRLGMCVLKFACLYQIAMSPDHPAITEEAMRYAISLGNYLKGHIASLVTDGLTVTKDGRELLGVKEVIAAEPGIDRSTLIRRTRLKSRNLDALVQTLIESGEVACSVERVESGAGRPKLSYRVEAG